MNHINIGLFPLPVTVTNEGLYASATRNMILPVVTVNGQVDNPNHIWYYDIVSQLDTCRTCTMCNTIFAYARFAALLSCKAI